MRSKVLWFSSLLPGIVIYALALRSGISLEASSSKLEIIRAATGVGCGMFSLALLRSAFKTGLGELAVLGAGLFGVAVLPLDALLSPMSEATGTSSPGSWLAVVFGMTISIPVLLPNIPSSRRALSHWRGYSFGAIGAVVMTLIALISLDQVIPQPNVTAWWTLIGLAAALIASIRISLRHLGLYEVGRNRASLFASIGLVYMGFSTTVWILNAPNSLAAWTAHTFEALSVMAAAVGLLIASQNNKSIATVFEPILATDPTVALRLGASPAVGTFLDSLANKDQHTHEHVTRVATMAMQLGRKLGLSNLELRDLGLAAILHDIGKTRVPDFILNKKGPLNDSEFEEMKLHTIWGEELLNREPHLKHVASMVRSHHERFDGRGYPDGLSAEQIPVSVGIISICDTWDALTKDRPYRQGMGYSAAKEVLLAASGAQWDGDLVSLLLDYVSLDDPSRSSLNDEPNNHSTNSEGISSVV